MNNSEFIAFRNFQVDLSDRKLGYLRDHVYVEGDRLYLIYNIDYVDVHISWQLGDKFVRVNTCMEPVTWLQRRKLKKLLNKQFLEEMEFPRFPN